MISEDLAGDKIELPYQYEFNGLVFGKGTVFRPESIEGLRTLPEVRHNLREVPGRHGASAGSSYYEPRTISWDMWVHGEPHTVDGLMDQLGAAFQLVDTGGRVDVEIPFVYKRPGVVLRRCWAKVSRLDFDTSYKFGMGLGEGSIELVASDPLWYSNKLSRKNVDMTEADGIINVWNDGNTRSSRFYIVLRGPLEPLTTVANDNDSTRTLILGPGIDIGEYLELDIFNRTATLYEDTDHYLDSDGTPVYNWAHPTSKWFDLVPGENQLVVDRGTSVSTSNIEVIWRNAWVV